MKSRSLGQTGLSLTEISFGCAPIAGLYQSVREEDALTTLMAAWDGGIRYYDTAPYYGAGLSEERLGRFLAGRPRADFAISTKVGKLVRPTAPQDAGNYGFVGAHPAVIDYDYSGDGILRSLEASRRRTGLDRFDIVFVHDIGEETHGVEGNRHHMWDFLDSGIKVLEDLKAAGDISAWGLGVNENTVCLDVMKRVDLDCILLAGRYTLLDRSAEAELLSLCRQRGTRLIIGGVFNSGILATGPVAGATFNYMPADADILRRVGDLQAQAQAKGLDLATAALHFPLYEPLVSSVLIGTAKPGSLSRNLAAYYDASGARLQE